MSVYDAMILDNMMRHARYLANGCGWIKALKGLPDFKYVGVDLLEYLGYQARTEYIIALDVAIGSGSSWVVKLRFSAEPSEDDILDKVVDMLGKIKSRCEGETDAP